MPRIIKTGHKYGQVATVVDPNVFGGRVKVRLEINDSEVSYTKDELVLIDKRQFDEQARNQQEQASREMQQAKISETPTASRQTSAKVTPTE